LTHEPIASVASGFLSQVERFYAGLISTADLGSSQDAEPSLGGKLLYVGELDAEARALLVAANIAGVASLAVSANPTARKQALRDGVVDFLVTSLDEALRILKNELRKRQAVAVCVAAAPSVPEAEFARNLLLRGVQPDLVRPIEQSRPRANQLLLAWRVASAAAIWLPKLDALAFDCLDKISGTPALDFETWVYRRWLRLAPRYLGRLAEETRLLRCDAVFAARFRHQVKEQVEEGVIDVPVEFMLNREGQHELYLFTPPVN
jgi:hypothetical protein